jgi:hypothetical protein
VVSRSVCLRRKFAGERESGRECRCYLSLSLSLRHTHTHTHSLSLSFTCEKEKIWRESACVCVCFVQCTVFVHEHFPFVCRDGHWSLTFTAARAGAVRQARRKTKFGGNFRTILICFYIASYCKFIVR